MEKWSKGEEAYWPPLDVDDNDDDDKEEEDEKPSLRFKLGQRVKCRTGPDPINGWVRGEVIQLWYTEAGWPANSWAPYKIQLDDGRYIFAPADQDHIICAEIP